MLNSRNPSTPLLLLGALGILFASVGAPQSGTAQTLPGIGDAKGTEINTEFMVFLRDSSRALVAQWQAAWQADDFESLAALYSHNAVLTTPGQGGRRGTEDIGAYLAKVLPTMGEVSTSTVVLDGSGDLAFIFGRYQLGGIEGMGTTTGDLGDHLTVLFQHRRQWTIRNQIFASKVVGNEAAWAPEGTAEPLPPLDLSDFPAEAVENVDWLKALYPSVSSLAVSFNDVWSSGNVEGLLSFSSEDLFLRTIEGEFVLGHDAIREALATEGTGFGNTIYLGPVDFTASTMVSVLHARFFLEGSASGEALALGPIFLLIRGSGNDLELRGIVFSSSTTN